MWNLIYRILRCSANRIYWYGSQIRVIPFVVFLSPVSVIAQEKEVSKSLDEVVVTAGRFRYTPQGVTVFPSISVKTASLDGFDVLQRLSLPNLLFSSSDKNISLGGSGRLLIRIDNINSTVKDLQMLPPSSIKRVELIQSPGQQYGEGVTAVLLVTTDKLFVGYTGGVTAQHYVDKYAGLLSPYVRLSGRNSLTTISLGARYNNAPSSYIEQTQLFRPPSADPIRFIKESSSVARRSNGGNIQLAQSWYGKHSDVLHLAGSYAYTSQTSPLQTTQGQWVGRSIFEELSESKDKSHKADLRLYYERPLSPKSSIRSELVGTLIKSDYFRSYGKSLAGASTYYQDYFAKGLHRSLIGEVLFSHKVAEHTSIDIGSKTSYSASNNEYVISGGTTPSKLNLFQSYNYAELKSKYKSYLSYGIGFGLTYYGISNNTNARSYLHLRPTLWLSYRLSPELRLQYNLLINPNRPSLSQVADIEQAKSDIEVARGNPGLKPYQAYQNTLQLSYSKGKFWASLVGYAQYNHEPLIASSLRYDELLSKFVYSTSNQDYSLHLQGKIASGLSLLRDKLNLSAYFVLNRYKAKGEGYNSTLLARPLWGWNASWDISKHFGLTGAFISDIETLYGENYTLTKYKLDFTAYYRIGKFRAEFIAHGIRLGGNQYESLSETRSPLLQSELKRYEPNSRGFAFRFTYTFGRGKSTKGVKTIGNRDNDTGIMR